MLRVIVNADDLGHGPRVNEAIFGWIARGRVSSATIIANAPDVAAATAAAADHPRCSFGVHLNVYEFAPLRPDPALAPLLDDAGRFAPRLRSVRRTPALLGAIFREWCAQIEHLQAAGVRLSHIDSHHHAHNLPEMLPLLWRLRTRYRIPCARVAMNLFDPAERKPLKLRAAKAAYNAALRGLCGFRTTRTLAFLGTAFRLHPERLARSGPVELMAHPGHPRYEDETRLLEELDAGRLPTHDRISFDELARRGAAAGPSAG